MGATEGSTPAATAILERSTTKSRREMLSDIGAPGTMGEACGCLKSGDADQRGSEQRSPQMVRLRPKLLSPAREWREELSLTADDPRELPLKIRVDPRPRS